MLRRSPPLMLLGTVLLLWAGSRLSMGFASTLLQPAPLPLVPGLVPFPAQGGLPGEVARLDIADQGLPVMVRLASRPVQGAVRRAEAPSLLAQASVPATPNPSAPQATANLPAPSRHAQLQSLMVAFHTSAALASQGFGHGSSSRFAGVAASRLPQVRARPAFVDNRWSGVAWLALRQAETGSGLSAVGSAAMLGGSQGGIRLARSMGSGRPAEAYARMTSTGRSMDGTEAAMGLSWQPVASVPLRVAIERRQRISGEDSRSAFAAMAVGGASDLRLPHGWRVDGYGAAGVVGLNRRDRFAEGSVRVSRPLASVAGISISGGGGVWGAAQPGVSRLDAGPSIDARWAGAAPRLSVDWRQRLAGDAAPGSGVALTLSTDF